MSTLRLASRMMRVQNETHAVSQTQIAIMREGGSLRLVRRMKAQYAICELRIRFTIRRINVCSMSFSVDRTINDIKSIPEK